ncbi:MAG: hypothetical protein AAGF87_06485, partial [Bacteroidota bacterium]
MVSEVAFQSLFLDRRGILLASLYFDKVIVCDSEIRIDNRTGKREEPIHEEYAYPQWDVTVKSLPPKIVSEFGLLKKEGVLEINAKPISELDSTPGFREHVIQVGKNYTKYSNSDRAEAREEIQSLLSGKTDIWKQYNSGGKLVNEYEFGLIMGLFSYLGLDTAIRRKVPFCTDNHILFEIMTYFFETQRNAENMVDAKLMNEFKKSSFALNVMDLILPDITTTKVEEVLNVRAKLKNELIPFREYMATLSWEIENNIIGIEYQQEIQKIIDKKIVPSIRDLENKIKSTKEKSVKNVFAKIKDPKTYVPLVGSIFTN